MERARRVAEERNVRRHGLDADSAGGRRGRGRGRGRGRPHELGSHRLRPAREVEARPGGLEGRRPGLGSHSAAPAIDPSHRVLALVAPDVDEDLIFF